ncbi:ATP-binding protein [Mucilaginibacter sp. cycad4]|uniref:ATP-binding protein n=1 Tax=Mucilaginibacter sp. cycad4 TaxID=3342096 RepID=UPI002AAAF633|nr:ATP-binding protein [Mucilaginibacter gossypii]WPV00578.1 ATP-binding protein [Mucilaginibacter gossypii]
MNNKTTLFKNIIFVGGIHGVGKSTICHRLVNALNINYLSASEVLKWKDINTDFKNKLVSDIPDTQDRLLRGLHNVVNHDHHYILDGHFCLFNKDGVATKVPLKTFSAINPIYLVVIVGDTAKVADGLKNRDEKTYSEKSLAYMQTMELHYAQEISTELSVPLFVYDTSQSDLSYNKLLSQLHESLT